MPPPAVPRAATNVQSPQLDTGAWIQILALIVSLILAAAASAAETAFTSINRITLKNLGEEGDEKAKKIEQLIAQPNVLLSTILVVNNVAVIVASSIATVRELRFSPNYGELIATLLRSLLVVIFCE